MSEILQQALRIGGADQEDQSQEVDLLKIDEKGWALTRLTVTVSKVRFGGVLVISRTCFWQRPYSNSGESSRGRPRLIRPLPIKELADALDEQKPFRLGLVVRGSANWDHCAR